MALGQALSRILGVQAASPRNALDDFWWNPIGQSTSSGVYVGADAALSTSPVWACVRLIADPIATLPLILYKRRPDGGKDRAPQHWLYSLLHDQPNEIQTAFTWKRTSMVHSLLWGNAYSRIYRGQRGFVNELKPLHPDFVTPAPQSNGTMFYRVRPGAETGQASGGPDELVRDDEIFHVPGLSLDGIKGLSLMAYARESIGLALSTQSYTARFFSQNAQPGGVLKHPGRLSKEGMQRLREDWQQLHAGLNNAWKTAVLEEGMEFQATGMTNTDAQVLQLIQWNIEDLARWFNVPLHMIGETSKVTSWGSGIEQLSIGFVTYSLLPWMENIQQTVKKDLIFQDQTYFAEFLTDALLRGNQKDRYDAYKIAIDSKFLTPNEVRDRENMNPLDGGDEFAAPPLPPASPPPAETPMQPGDQTDMPMEEPSRNGNGRAHDVDPRMLVLWQAPPPAPEVHNQITVQQAEADPPPAVEIHNAYDFNFPQPPAPPPDTERLKQFVHDAAARVVRKEIAAMARAGSKMDDIQFAVYAHEFYASHAEYVAETMRISMSAAEEYVAAQRDYGAATIKDREAECIQQLIDLALATEEATV